VPAQSRANGAGSSEQWSPNPPLGYTSNSKPETGLAPDAKTAKTCITGQTKGDMEATEGCGHHAAISAACDLRVVARAVVDWTP
jgi:hypothetical protein